MSEYEVDISITDTSTDKEVLRITVTREHVQAALLAAADGAATVLKGLATGAGVLVIPPNLPVRVDPGNAYCLTHDMVWNAKGHDAQMWCSTREATDAELEAADLSVEDRQFTTEPAEIEQMEQRVVGVDPATTPDGNPTIVEGVVKGGVLHIGMPRGTDPHTIAQTVKGLSQTTIATLPEDDTRTRQQSLSEGQDRIYGAGH